MKQNTVFWEEPNFIKHDFGVLKFVQFFFYLQLLGELNHFQLVKAIVF